MQYKTYDMGAYKLHVIKTKKFKTITINISFRRKIKENEIAYSNILKEVMLSSNANFHEEIELIKETENLYDLKLQASSSRIGNYLNLVFKMRFLNDKYTEKGMFTESLEFLLDIVFNPYIKNEAFDKMTVDLAKDRLKKEKESVKDNKIKYALLELLSKYEDKPYSYNPYGNNIDEVNEKSLYEYYQSVIKKDIVDIFVVGDVDVANLKEILKEKAKLHTYHKETDNLLVSYLPYTKKYTNYQETDNVNQCQLVMMYNYRDITEFERKYVLLIYNELLGASPSSLLFKIVREENSLCYYVNSLVKMYDNFMIIYSGVEPGKETDAIKLIEKTVASITKGSFSEDLIDDAKASIIAGITASCDSPVGIINTCFAREIAGSDPAEERIKKINKVTKEDIIKLSVKIKLHSLLTLKGDKDGN